jgi:hypothetical protein
LKEIFFLMPLSSDGKVSLSQQKEENFQCPSGVWERENARGKPLKFNFETIKKMTTDWKHPVATSSSLLFLFITPRSNAMGRRLKYHFFDN